MSINLILGFEGQTSYEIVGKTLDLSLKAEFVASSGIKNQENDN